MRTLFRRLLLLVCLGNGALSPLLAQASPGGQRLEPTRFAWLAQGQAQLWQEDSQDVRALPRSAGRPLPDSLRTPLGSVWKLFVYAYLVDQKISSSDYDCAGRDPEDVYCCSKGGHIDRERALVQSCGPYFALARLNIDPTAWAQYWRGLKAPLWLTELPRVGPATTVSVNSLLSALAIVPPEARASASSTLVSVLTSGRGQGTVSRYGSLLRVKTWTMPDRQRPGMSIGGAAGWLVDGTPVWLGGPGGSARVLAHASPLVAPLIQTVPVPDDSACVVVNFFTRYPVRTVLSQGSDTSVPDGPLRGVYRVGFDNGNWLRIESRDDMMLSHTSMGQAVISGRFGMNDYVARVVQREGGVAPLEAARALAVAARTYVIQRAVMQRGCYVIADSSATQRVLPAPPVAAAQAVADDTDALVLVGATAQYRRDQAAAGQMSWQAAQAGAREGRSFDAILARTWPQAMLTSFQSPLSDDCEPVAGAQRWLEDNAQRWAQRLQAVPGFELPPTPAVCMVRQGRPYADAQRNRVYIYRFYSEEDHIALAHEYLHLAFQDYPLGQDEGFVEHTARELIRTDGPIQ